LLLKIYEDMLTDVKIYGFIFMHFDQKQRKERGTPGKSPVFSPNFRFFLWHLAQNGGMMFWAVSANGKA